MGSCGDGWPRVGRITVFRDHGVFVCRPFVKWAPGARARRLYHSMPGARDEAEAAEMAREWVSGWVEHGRPLRELVAEHLREEAAMGVEPNTLRSHEEIARNHVVPRVGSVQARDLTPRDVREMELDLLSPRAEGGAGLSRSSVRAVHFFLRSLYSDLVDMHEADSNPVAAVRPPRPEDREAVALGPDEIASLVPELDRLRTSGESPRARCVGMAAWVSLVTGMRCGEVCALRRMDFSASARTLRVAGTVVEVAGSGRVRRNHAKRRSDRVLAITGEEAEAVAAFDAWESASASGEGRPRGRESPLITWDGRFMSPSQVARLYRALLTVPLGLPPGSSFHTLRHTHASILLSGGASVESVRRRLGHADPATTMRVYAHSMPADADGAAQIAQRALEAAAGGCDGAIGGVDG